MDLHWIDGESTWGSDDGFCLDESLASARDTHLVWSWCGCLGSTLGLGLGVDEGTDPGFDDGLALGLERGFEDGSMLGWRLGFKVDG